MHNIIHIYLLINKILGLIKSYVHKIQHMKSDYQIIDRKNGSSVKYNLALNHKQPTVNQENSLIVSHADMQFKFPEAIYAKLKQNLGEPHFGYTMAKASVWKALNEWVKGRYTKEIETSLDNTVLWHNMLTVYNGILQVLTNPGDNILVFTPSYYRFIVQAKYKKRNMVELQLKTENKRYFINFEQMEQILKTKDIKLFVLINPHNPCGRIWSYQQLRKIKDLMIKYKCNIFSDQIYADSVQPSQGQQIGDKFTSMLRFPDLYQYLIFASSYSKTWNSSGMSIAYSIIMNKQMFKALSYHMDVGLAAFPSAISFSILQTIYTAKQSLEWRKETIKYVNKNYCLFKELCSDKLSKLYFYDLQASYLCLVDFREYGLCGKELQDMFSAIDVCPTFTEQFFVEQKPRSLVRFNLACNVEVIRELVKRLQKALYEQ